MWLSAQPLLPPSFWPVDWNSLQGLRKSVICREHPAVSVWSSSQQLKLDQIVSRTTNSNIELQYVVIISSLSARVFQDHQAQHTVVISKEIGQEGRDRTYCDHQDLHTYVDIVPGLGRFTRIRIIHLLILSVTTTSLSNEGSSGVFNVTAGTDNAPCSL